MTNPYRALCAELVAEIEKWQQADDEFSDAGTIRADANYDLAPRARALLAQPVPEVPTDEELDAFIYGFFFEDDWYYNTEMERGLTRAVLAKWGHQ
jgi:hypothetical protein